MKNKSFQSFLAIFVFVIIGGFLFFVNIQKASAQESTTKPCSCGSKGFYCSTTNRVGDTSYFSTQEECANYCSEVSEAKYYAFNGSSCISVPGKAWENTKENAKQIPKMLGSDSCALGMLNPGNWIPCILMAVLKFLSWILTIAVSIFTWAADARSLSAVINGESIYEAWKLVRDLLNMAFIIVLVYTAFTIIFQVDSSNKKIILTVVLMALLVNFSFPIARFIIDVGNSLMYTIFNNLFNDAKDPSQIISYITNGAEIGKIVNFTYTGASMTQLIAAIVFMAILSVTFLIMSVLFLIRIIALAIVIIFSPIAFVGAAIPSMSSKTGQWWDYLFKYTFFGPAMALMIYIAIMVMKTTNAVALSIGAQSNAVNGTLITAMSTFAIPIVILWIGMGLAQKMGIEGASAVTGAGEKALSWAGKTFSGYRAGKWFATKAVPSMTKAGLETFEEKVLAKRGLSPTAFIEGWKKRAKDKRDEAINPAIGAWHDRLNRWKSFGKEKTDFAFASHESEVSKNVKELSDTTTNADYIIPQLENAIKMGDQAKVEACMKILAKENNFNDMMQAIGDKFGDKTKNSNPTHIKNALKDMFQKAGVKDEQLLAKQLIGISEISIGAGNVGLAGMGVFDKKTNKFRVSETSEQAQIAKAKFQNLEPQTRQRTLHQNSVITEGVGEEVHDIDEVQAAIISAFNETDVAQIGRSRDDLRRQVARAAKGYNKDRSKFKNFENSMLKNRSFMDYVTEAEKRINI